MNKTTIEFADYTWNPITGCQHGCPYCWAEKFNNRYFKQNFKIPQIHEERLLEKVPGLPKNRISNPIAESISPDKPVIFTVDMGDIFSPGVGAAWRSEVFKYVYKNDKAVFLFLTKNPVEYLRNRLAIPKGNTIIGTSLDYAHNLKRVDYVKRMTDFGYRTFVNIEPLMSMMDAVDFSGIDFVVVGALTGRKYRPDARWHRSIKHDKIYFKRNYQVYFSELKNMNNE